MDKRLGKTLASRLAEKRRETGEPLGSEEKPPEPASQPVETAPKRPRSFLEKHKPAPFAAVAEAPEAAPEIKEGALENFQRTGGGILQEIVPGLQSWLRDWAKRRKIHLILGRHRGLPSESTQGDGDAKDAVSRPARALPKLSSPRARRRRIARWRTFRPVLRWQRRASLATVLVTYFGILGVLSLSVTAFFLVPARHEVVVPKTPVPIIVSMQLGTRPRKTLQQPPAVVPRDLARLQDQAEKDFRSGNYAAAESGFRELLPVARFRALTGFQIFLCLLKQGKTAEAEFMGERFPTGTSAKNPSGIYVSAATAFLQGRTEDGRSAIESAHRQFPLICPLYDKALADAGLAPEE